MKPGLAMANPEAAMALASPVGLRFLLDPMEVRLHGSFLPSLLALVDKPPEEAMEAVSESR